MDSDPPLSRASRRDFIIAFLGWRLHRGINPHKSPKSLIYRIDEEGLILIATRTGSHSELLGL